MGTTWGTLVLAGFTASVLSACAFWLFRALKVTEFSPTTQLGCLVSGDPRLPLTETVGVVLFMLLGCTLLPLLYAAAMRGLGGVGWGTGAAVGAVHGVLAAAGLPWAARYSACVRNGHLPLPGMLGVRWGAATPAVVVAGHVLYGAVLGAVMGAA
ncbi:MAG: hypothetical protein JWM27_1419 [Gemmatimonadetes bacterium]|nr:hypothetical protein [Gemmatimonadota bacterium]